MDLLQPWNQAIAYIEAHLCDEIDLEALSRIAGVSQDSFLRFFSYLTGISLHEYLRRRRLTLAVRDLQTGSDRIIDLAVKYGYESADAFSRAFARQHGTTPSSCRKHGTPCKITPPVSFHITVKGANEMDFRILELPECKTVGYSKAFDPQKFPTREALRHTVWSEAEENIPAKLCAGTWNQPGNTNYDGIWYGIWRDGRYFLTRSPQQTQFPAPESITLPAGTYAAFRTQPGTLAWEEFPKLFEEIFDAWLPASGYSLQSETIVEVYHLWTDHDQRKHHRYFEVWIPITAK